jgi:hypothetical protein
MFIFIIFFFFSHLITNRRSRTARDRQHVTLQPGFHAFDIRQEAFQIQGASNSIRFAFFASLGVSIKNVGNITRGTGIGLIRVKEVS